MQRRLRTTPARACVALAMLAIALACRARPASPQFSARVDDLDIAGTVFGIFVSPGALLTIGAQALPSGADMQLDTHALAAARPTGAAQWRWRAPRKPGAYAITLRNGSRGMAMRLNVFVETPFDHQRDTLDGYRIGRYPPQALRDNPAYARPSGFIAVTPANVHTRIAPHFTLGDFLCHQQPDHWPKYLLIRPRLLLKLEAVLTTLRHRGLDLDTLTVMSGFRTPWYNADIGNTTIYSRHLYGGAADIFVDGDSDGRMDDLDGDGAIDKGDARWLADVIESVVADAPELAGGLSAYAANAHHGPFVHMDVRGTPARW